MHNRRDDDDDDSVIFLKQAHVTLKKLGRAGLRLKGGRMLFAAGAEVMNKDGAWPPLLLSENVGP